MRKALLLLLALALAAPAVAWATGGADEENMAQTAKGLSIQALTLLEQLGDNEAAAEKLDEALESEDTRGVDIRAIRAALAALREEDEAKAERLLQEAFPGESHLVGVTFRPAIGTAQAVAGILGAAALALAALGLARRRAADGRYGSEPKA